MECSLTEILDYELVIEDKIGFNFEAFVIIYNDVDDYNHDQLRRHIEKISNDKIRMKNQLSRKYDEKLYLFNNCHNMNIYIKTIHLVIEKCDLKPYWQYLCKRFNETITELTLKHEGLKSEATNKNKQHMKEHASEEITCECGAIVSRRHIARHKATKKHLDNMPCKECI